MTTQPQPDPMGPLATYIYGIACFSFGVFIQGKEPDVWWFTNVFLFAVMLLALKGAICMVKDLIK